jgi:RNA recognition motif-containing protein
MVEFTERDHARRAIAELNGKTLLGNAISVSWAFVQ